jgi:hypothetical protein
VPRRARACLPHTQLLWARHPLNKATGSSGTPSPPDGLCGLLATGYYFKTDAGDHLCDDGLGRPIRAPRTPRRRGLHVGPLGLAALRCLPALRGGRTPRGRSGPGDLRVGSRMARGARGRRTLPPRAARPGSRRWCLPRLRRSRTSIASSSAPSSRASQAVLRAGARQLSG